MEGQGEVVSEGPGHLHRCGSGQLTSWHGRRCPGMGWLTCGFVSTLALFLKLPLSDHPQAAWLEENAFLSHLGSGHVPAQLDGPSSQTAGLPAGAQSARAAKPLMQLILGRDFGVACVLPSPGEAAPCSQTAQLRGVKS